MRIGKEDYPVLSFSDAVKDLKKFYDRLKGKASSMKSLAEALNHKPTSGWFKIKVADMKRYGLIEGRGNFSITSLGQEILFFNNKKEYQSALKSVLNNIPLFKRIYERVGKDVQDESNFRAVLTDITNEEKGKIKEKSEQIRNVYIDLITNIDDGFDVNHDKNTKNYQKNYQGDVPTNMIKAEAADVYIQMPKDKKSIPIAEQLLGILKTQISNEEKSLSEEKKK